MRQVWRAQRCNAENERQRSKLRESVAHTPFAARYQLMRFGIANARFHFILAATGRCSAERENGFDSPLYVIAKGEEIDDDRPKRSHILYPEKCL